MPNQLRADRVYLGWQYTLLHPDPGTPPPRPVPPERERIHPDWMEAQRREERKLNRPLEILVGAGLLGAVLFLVLGLAGMNRWFAAVLIGMCLAFSTIVGIALLQGRRALRERLTEERNRLDRMQAQRERKLHAAQEEHAQKFETWRARKASFDTQLQWYAVSIPREVQRVDVAGGTISGWSAFVTTLGATRLDSGSEVTVLDLSEGSVAGELVELARHGDHDPLVWVLPDDLPRLDLGAGLDAEAMGDVLSLVVSVSEEQASTRDHAFDAAILERVLEVFDGRASIAQTTAGLRALAQIGDPRDDLRRGLLEQPQLDRLSRMFGRGAAERVVLERAWTLEAQLRKLDSLGAHVVPFAPTQLKVVSMARQGGVLGNKVLGTYVTSALLHELRQAPRREPWSHTLIVCGAERLRGDVLDRIYEACEQNATGLVAMYRSIPEPVKERLGRGNSAAAFMRLGNAEDAKIASEHIGTEHRFVLSQLSETVGSSTTDTAGDSYTSTTGVNESISLSTSTTKTKSRSRGRGRSDETPWGALGDSTWSRNRDRGWSQASTEGDTVTDGVSKGSSWARSTSQAVASNESLSRTVQRSREFLVEQWELQQLPTSAVILSHNSPSGRRVVLADANPAILALPRATLLSLDEARDGVAATPSEWTDPYANADDDQSALVERRVVPRPSPTPPDPMPTAPSPGPAVAESRPTAPNEPVSARRRVPRPVPKLLRRPGSESGSNPWFQKDGDQPPPNLGPPPQRLDWRKRRKR